MEGLGDIAMRPKDGILSPPLLERSACCLTMGRVVTECQELQDGDDGSVLFTGQGREPRWLSVWRT